MKLLRFESHKITGCFFAFCEKVHFLTSKLENKRPEEAKDIRNKIVKL